MTDKEFTEVQKTAMRETISRSAELMALLYQLDEEQLDKRIHIYKSSFRRAITVWYFSLLIIEAIFKSSE